MNEAESMKKGQGIDKGRVELSRPGQSGKAENQRYERKRYLLRIKTIQERRLSKGTYFTLRYCVRCAPDVLRALLTRYGLR